MPPDSVRVLIVDDSRIFRSALEKALGSDPRIIIAGSVWSGEKALHLLQTTPFDVVTLDVEMPDMNGIETLRAIRDLARTRPELSRVKVIMVSAFTSSGAAVTIDALAAGAFDVVTKPTAQESRDAQGGLEALRSQLLPLIFAATPRPISGRFTTPSVVRPRSRSATFVPATSVSASGFDAIVIGSSTGGPKALTQLLPELCELTTLPILLVQHMPPFFTKSLAENLDKRCSHAVVEAEDCMFVRPQFVYIAPGGRHMVVRRTAAGQVQIGLNDMPPENSCRPSCDVLFRSSATVFQNRQVALILTGMGNDGTKGLSALKRAGVRVIAQDEASSVVWGMPGSAVAAGVTDHTVDLQQIPHLVEKILSRGGDL